jgi:hypothetical protein
MTLIYGAGGGGGKTSTPKAKQPPKPIIAQDDPALKSISFAKLQFLLCEGEIEGPAFGNTRAGLEQSVLLDGTPIRRPGSANVSPQPEDLVFSYGRDHTLQSGVPDYNRVTNTIGVDQQVDFGSPVAQAVPQTIAGGSYYARVLLTWRQLLVSIIDGDGAPISGPTGSIKTYTVNYSVTYTDVDGTLRTPFNGNVQGKFSSTFQRSHEFILEGNGPWTITVTRLTVNDADAYGGDPRVAASSEFNFSSVIQALDQKFSFANSSVLSVGVKADNYSQIPNVAIDLKGQRVEIPTNATVQADGSLTFAGAWDGTFKTEWCCDPAWCLRDLILNDRYGAGQYIDEAFIDKWSLYEISEYCNQQVPAPNGGTEPRFTCNLLLQSSGQAWEVLQQLSSIFRGMVYYAGSIAVAAQDKEKDAIFTFNESNTIQEVDDSGQVSAGNFTYSGSARRAIHTVALVSWDDPASNYEPRIEYMTDDETYIDFGYRPIDLRLLGVTSRGQALRAGSWTLLSERLLSDTIAFRTNEIGMALRPGDIVKVADPTKAAVRGGGRITAVNGLDITLDYIPDNPPGGVVGSEFSWMYNEAVAGYDGDNQPRLETATVTALVNPTTVRIDGDGGHPPAVNNPFLLEFPNRTAQEFRVLTVTQEEGGVYAITGLRYRSDIYDAVDFDTPLEEDPTYLFQAINPDAPTNVQAQVIWDNNSAKIDVKWDPPANSLVLFEYDLTVQSYRVQWQSGSIQSDSTIQWSGSWSERPQQEDDRDLIPIEELSIEDAFRVRICAVGRLGVQSEWSTYVTADSITTWFPMPDLSVGSVLSYLNQSSGGQLFTWDFSGLAVPPYVSGVQLDVSPNRALTPQEQAGLKPPIPGTDTPPAFGTYIYGDYPLEEYAVTIFHADTNWTCRIHFLTFVVGLEGDTFATSIVQRCDIVPPAPDLFTVVTDTDKESIAPMRRFSWALPTSEIEGSVGPDPSTCAANCLCQWPLGKVTDITQFLVRYKAGFNNTWAQGVSLFADGVPGDQRYFETELFDGGTWTVMIRSVDKTGWVSDDQAAIIVNLGDAIPTNVVETFDAEADGWPGQKVNCAVNADGFLQQTDPTQDAEYLYPFEVTAPDAGLLITTAATNTDPLKNGDGGTVDQGGTYQWFLREIGTDLQDPMYPDPQGDPMYPPPQTDYMYLNTNQTIGVAFHPYVPFEKLPAGNYELGCRIKSIDAAAATILTVTQVQLDYPDVTQTMEDVAVDDSGNDFIAFPKNFPHACKAVSCTLQDPDGAVTVPATAYIRGKDVSGFNIRLIDADGEVVAGLIDVTAVGY